MNLDRFASLLKEYARNRMTEEELEVLIDEIFAFSNFHGSLGKNQDVS